MDAIVQVLDGNLPARRPQSDQGEEADQLSEGDV